MQQDKGSAYFLQIGVILIFRSFVKTVKNQDNPW